MEKAPPRRKQKKTKFSKPHIKYKENQELCEELRAKYFEYLNNPQIDDCRILTMLFKEYKVPRPTLVGWAKRWEVDPNWLPGNFDRYAMVKRIFDDATERAVSEYIEDNYITPGYYFPDSSFKDIIFQTYLESENIKRDFHCSPGFIRDFKVRNRFSSRLAHIKKRPDVEQDQNGKSKIDAFIEKVRNVIIESADNDEPVVNADETGWQILPPKMKTWARTNSTNIIINVKDNERAHISAMCSITADLKKLPIFFIAKGNTAACEDSQIGDEIFPNVATHSPKAYMNTKCFIQYLKFLRDQFPDGKKIHLIVDSYSSHVAKASKMAAERNNIELIFIPSGYTDKYQPLDIAVFSVLKSIANGKLRKFLKNNPNTKLGMKRSVETLMESYDLISDDTLLKAWEQYL